jgi:LPS-assembly lipoprotein
LLLPLAMFGLLLGGCSLTPLYAGGTQGAVAQGLADVKIAPIEGRAGWLVRNALEQRLDALDGGSSQRYRLIVTLDDDITGYGVRRDNAVTRERRTLRARYQLTDSTNGEVVLDATASSDAGIDVVSSEYATIAAEDSALERLAEMIADQIVARLAIYARNMDAAATAP